MRRVRSSPWLLVVWLGACAGVPEEPIARGDPPRGPAMKRFADGTAASGVDFAYATRDFKGGGLAVVDLDGDDLPEIVAGRRVGGLALFHNLGGRRFAPVAAAVSGLDDTLAISAIAAADLDNDGDTDLVLAGPNVTYVMANQGDGTFVMAARFADAGLTEHVLPVDLDGDGLLDLYLGNYDISNGIATVNQLYMNRGGLQFGPPTLAGSGMTWSTTAFDFDGDGDQDLYVANDTLLADFGRADDAPPTSPLHADLFLRNDGPGPDGVPRLTDIADTLGLTRPRSSMGGLLGDFDDDGRLDLYVPNYGADPLFVRDPAGGFVERAAAIGVTGTARRNLLCTANTDVETCLLLSWSAALSDFDLDGYDELLVVNGETVLGDPPPVLMFARGAALPYHEVAPDLDSVDARGLIVTDLDGDGDQDVVISPKQGPLTLHENIGTPAAERWLRVTLRGHASNREGRGAIVTIHQASGRSQVRIVGSGGVIHSAGPAEAFFGLGRDAVTSIEVLWPSGRHTDAGPATGALILDEGL